MKQADIMDCEFVRSFPDELAEQTLYVSMEFGSVAHLCCCGCGNEVVTKLSPTDWKLTYDGVGVSLAPSIGNWGLACRSHYWIRGSDIIWAEQWSDKQIGDAREADRRAKARYFDQSEHSASQGKSDQPNGIVAWLKNLFH